MASVCATMLIVAAGLVFRKRTRQTGALAPRRNRHMVRQPLQPLQPLRRTRWIRVAGMIKKTVYRSSERRVRGEDDKIPPINTVAPDLPLDALQSPRLWIGAGPTNGQSRFVMRSTPRPPDGFCIPACDPARPAASGSCD